MSFDKVPANAVKGSGVDALTDPKASVASLMAAQTKAVEAEDKCNAELAGLVTSFKTAMKDSDIAGKKYDAVIQHKTTVKKAQAAAVATKTKANQALSDARSAFLAAETGVERQANTSKAAAALTGKITAKLAAAKKAFDQAQSELQNQKTELAKSEKVLKKTPDDKRAIKEKAAAEKEIKKFEAEVKASGMALKKSSDEAAALKSALERAGSGVSAAKKALDEAGAKVDEAVKLDNAAKKKVDEATASLAEAVKALAAIEEAAEEPSARIEAIQRAMPLAKQKMLSAHGAAADAKTELANRLDVEQMLNPVLPKTANLLAQLRTELAAIAAPTLQAPAVLTRLTPLQAAVTRQGTVQSNLESARAKKELAGKANELADLITELNSLSDEVTSLIKDVPGFRASHFKVQLEKFYDATVKANLKLHVKAEDVKLPKTLEAQITAADGKGWSDDAIAKAEQTLTNKIKEKIDALHARGVEKAAILALTDDATYTNLAGLIFEVNQLANKDGSTLATATAVLDTLLAKQRKPSAAKWRTYLGRNGITEGSPGAGVGYHITLKGAFLSPNIGSIDLANDSNAAAMKKMFKLSKDILEIHASLESSGPINTVHYYFSGKYVGNPSGSVKTALKKAMDDWLRDNVETLIDRARAKDGNLDML